MMGLTVVQTGKLEMRALLGACSIYGLIWVSEFSVSSMCMHTYTPFFVCWKFGTSSLTSEIPVQFLFCTIRPTCCYLIEWFSVQVGGVLVREMESGRAAQF